MLKNINGKELRPLITSDQISTRVHELGEELTRDYRGKNPLFIGILKGGFIFLADLIRHVELDVELDFIRASSYREGAHPGELELLHDISAPIKGRHVLLVDDIVDPGATMEHIRGIILSRAPASLKTCAMVDKRERRKTDIEPDYLGCEIEEGFIVGYGTDYAGRGRNLPDIFVIE